MCSVDDIRETSATSVGVRRHDNLRIPFFSVWRSPEQPPVAWSQNRPGVEDCGATWGVLCKVKQSDIRRIIRCLFFLFRRVCSIHRLKAIFFFISNECFRPSMGSPCIRSSKLVPGSDVGRWEAMRPVDCTRYAFGPCENPGSCDAGNGAFRASPLLR